MMAALVVSTLPSLYFPSCVIIETACGHRHVRPRSFGVKVGDYFDCGYEHAGYLAPPEDPRVNMLRELCDL